MAEATNTNEGGDLPSTKSYLPEKWTGNLVGTMHIHGISCIQLAEAAGWHPKYLSVVLN